jgi:hypothetical protein
MTQSRVAELKPLIKLTVLVAQDVTPHLVLARLG